MCGRGGGGCEWVWMCVWGGEGRCVCVWVNESECEWVSEWGCMCVCGQPINHSTNKSTNESITQLFNPLINKHPKTNHLPTNKNQSVSFQVIQLQLKLSVLSGDSAAMKLSQCLFRFAAAMKLSQCLFRFAAATKTQATSFWVTQLRLRLSQCLFGWFSCH